MLRYEMGKNGLTAGRRKECTLVLQSGMPLNSMPLNLEPRDEWTQGFYTESAFQSGMSVIGHNSGMNQVHRVAQSMQGDQQAPRQCQSHTITVTCYHS